MGTAALQAERAEHEAKKRAQKEAERKRIADAMQQNYINWHTKEQQVCSVPSGDLAAAGCLDPSGRP